MKIHIFGASGSGVTTTGRLLAEEFGIRYFDSDDYFWINTDLPFTKRRNSNERNRLISRDLHNAESWILGGSVINWGDNLFPEFDLIIFLYVPGDLRVERLKKREFEKYGNIIYTDEKRAKQFKDFIDWAIDYDNHTGLANRTLNAHENWLEKTNSPILKIIGNQSLDMILNKILKKIAEEDKYNLTK